MTTEKKTMTIEERGHNIAVVFGHPTSHIFRIAPAKKNGVTVHRNTGGSGEWLGVVENRDAAIELIEKLYGAFLRF